MPRLSISPLNSSRLSTRNEMPPTMMSITSGPRPANSRTRYSTGSDLPLARGIAAATITSRRTLRVPETSGSASSPLPNRSA